MANNPYFQPPSVRNTKLNNKPNVINNGYFSKSSKHKKPNVIDNNTLGSGSYGIVFRKKNNNSKTIKVFYKQSNAHKIKKNHTRLKQNKHVTYNITESTIQKLGNLKQNYPTQYPIIYHSLLQGNYKNRSNLSNNTNIHPYIIELPYLGTSIHQLSKSNNFIIPSNHLATVLQSCKNIIEQLIQFKKDRFIHGDIHPGNVLFDTTTYQLTIIDYDLAGTYEEYWSSYNFKMFLLGSFRCPPESLLLYYDVASTIQTNGTKKLIFDNSNGTIELSRNQTIRIYTNGLLSNYPTYFKTIFPSYTNNALKTSLFNVIKNINSTVTFLENGKPIVEDDYMPFILKNIIPQIDSFSMGMVLSELFAMFANNHSYTTQDITKIKKAQLLFENMASLTIPERITPEDALQEIIRIIQ